jgi:anti-sigma-K factor RskA
MTTIHELAGAYAVHALDDLEQATFEAHLRDCPDCREEVAGHREVLAALAAAQPALPPADLEERILTAATTAHDRGVTPSAVVPGAARRRPVWRSLAAAAVVLGVFAGGAVVGRASAPDAGPSSIAAPLDAALAVTSAGDAQVLPVDVMGASSRMVVSGAMGKAVFVGADLPTPAKGQCYQVWRVAADGTKSSAGVFTPGPDGRVVAVLEAAPDTDGFVITLEPPGGSKTPSGPMVGQVNA